MTFEKRRYEAAKYLLLKDKELSELSLDCFEDEKIFFNRLCRQSLTGESYASLQAAKALYDGSGNISLDELASRRDVNDPCFRRIVRAIAIARFGPDGEQVNASGKQKVAITHEL